jgi:hypothetical protein
MLAAVGLVSSSLTAMLDSSCTFLSFSADNALGAAASVQTAIMDMD